MWENLANREVSAPFVPRFSHEGDASNFLIMEETEEPLTDSQNPIDSSIFANF